MQVQTFTKKQVTKYYHPANYNKIHNGTCSWIHMQNTSVVTSTIWLSAEYTDFFYLFLVLYHFLNIP